MTLRCVIVDDSPAVLRGASELLEGEGIAVVGVAATSAEALRLIEGLKPDVVLVDIDLRRRERLRARPPSRGHSGTARGRGPS